MTELTKTIWTWCSRDPIDPYPRRTVGAALLAPLPSATRRLHDKDGRMAKWVVVGTWFLEAPTAHQAENLIEDAIAKHVPNAELETCDANLEDGEREDDDASD